MRLVGLTLSALVLVAACDQVLRYPVVPAPGTDADGPIVPFDGAPPPPVDGLVPPDAAPRPPDGLPVWPDISSRSDAAPADATPQCPPGQTWCPGGCVDLQTNADHCGSCGNVCALIGQGLTCARAQCMPAVCGDSTLSLALRFDSTPINSVDGKGPITLPPLAYATSGKPAPSLARSASYLAAQYSGSYLGTGGWTLAFWLAPDFFTASSPVDRYVARLVYGTGDAVHVLHHVDAAGNWLGATVAPGGDDPADPALVHDWTSTSKLASGAWVHVAVTYEPSPPAVRVYFDGTLKTTSLASAGSSISTSPAAVWIGGYGGTSPTSAVETLQAKLDEVLLFRRVLTPAEIASLPLKPCR